jgi:gliding motility-associated protein GldE
MNVLLSAFAGGFSPGIFLILLIILLLLFCSALISGAEIAYFSLTPAQLKEIKSKDTPVNKVILEHLKAPKRLLATILITNNFINVGIVILSTYVSSRLFDFTLYPVFGFLVEIVVITFVLLLFGEIMPKIYANQKQILFAVWVALPLKILTKVFYPVSSLLMSTTRVIDKKLARQGQSISMSDLSDAIDLTVESGTPPEETKILKGIVRFSDITVSEIMRSRMDVVAVDITLPFNKVIEVVVESGYSRIPAFEESFDSIKGVLYVKDLLPFLNNDDHFNWTTLLRPSFFVPENKKINDLLQEFQEKKIHLAIVVDEYGGTSGIVTMEDIIEEIIGEITDEFDTPEDGIGFKKLDSNNYIFEGKTSINDFCKVTGFDDDVFDEIKGDADSIAGIILELLGEIPEKGQDILYRNFNFKIISADKRRIKQIKVTLLTTGEEKAETEKHGS